jgi:hypothetical protein
MRVVSWVPLLACPAVPAQKALLGKPAVAPTSQSVITFENCYKRYICAVSLLWTYRIPDKYILIYNQRSCEGHKAACAQFGAQ